MRKVVGKLRRFKFSTNWLVLKLGIYFVAAWL